MFSDGSLGTLGYITFKKKRTPPQNKNQMQVIQVEGPPGLRLLGLCSLPKASDCGQAHGLAPFPRTREQSPGLGAAEMQDKDLYSPRPAHLSLQSPDSNRNTFYIFLLCALRPLIPPIYLSLWV